MKVILVGSSGVGKTSLISAYTNNPFDNGTSPTVAPAQNSATVNIGDKTIDIEIWDTAGQEKFYAISQMFYRDSDAAIVCFDKNALDTVEGWVSRVRAEVPECTIILALTKEDMLTDEETEDLESKGHELMSTLNAHSFLLTSAKTRNGVKELFMDAAMAYNASYTQKSQVVNLTAEQHKENSCNC